MTPRVTTRSAAKLLTADQSSTNSDEPPSTATLPQTSSTRLPPPSARKRKAAQAEPISTNDDPPARKNKKTKVVDSEPLSQSPQTTNTRSKRGTKASVAAPAMSSGYDDGENTRRQSSSRRRQPSPPGLSSETSPTNLTATSSRRRSSRKKSAPGLTATSSSASSGKRTKKGLGKRDPNTSMNEPPSQEQHGDDDDNMMDPEEEDNNDEEEEEKAELEDKSDDEEHARRGEDLMDEDDPFTTSLLRGSGPSGLSNTLRALSGMMSGMTGRLRGILENLRARDDPSIQLIALTELSELLLVSNEDNLAGHFSADAFVKELVALMQPNDFGEENSEIMLLACRCVANLMEALPSATASVVYGGAVPVLCQKLLEIHFIDLAEQALSTLEKISVEFPSSIVREGGLTACLTYLDFFATSTQRTAVTTAANCCRNIPEDNFPVVRDVMPILLNVLGSNDQKVVEQGSLCVCRVVESFRWQENKLEELVSPELLRAVVRLLLPGSTNMIGASIHAQFLRVLAIVVRASPRLSVELLRMNVVDTLYQILTGVSPPAGTDDIATKIDKNIIMQALIRTPRDQIFETLNVICELLPSVYHESLMFLDELDDAGYTGAGSASMAARSRVSPNDKRVSLLADCPDEVRRFGIVLFPTLVHAYTSTVNFNVRQKVLTAQLKMLSNFEISMIEDALKGVPYASYLASIMTQQENPMLVTFAFQISELLLKRLEEIYRPQFYREGVMAEVMKLSQRPLNIKPKPEDARESSTRAKATEKPVETKIEDHKAEHRQEDSQDEGSDYDHHDEDEGEDDESDDHSIDEGPRRIGHPLTYDIQDIITQRAQKFVERYGPSPDEDANEATRAVKELRKLAQSLRECYSHHHDTSAGFELFNRLSPYFSSDALEGITSYELLTSGIVDALLEVFNADDANARIAARSAFLEVFMADAKLPKLATGIVDSPATAFSVLVLKLQDLLSRTEHFEVITVHQNAFDGNRSSAASMLAKQLRLKLSADDESGIPRPYRNIMVSIHAIATFRALDDYLRPRISLAEMPRKSSKPTTTTDAAATETATPPAPSTPKTFTKDSTAPASRAKHSNTSASGKDSSSGRLRRSSRRLSAKNGEDITDSTASRSASRHAQDALECADETQLSDEDDDIEAGMDTIMDDLNEEMDDEEDDDPSAVNLEVAKTGKVTAHKEDGTRVATPLQGSQTAQDTQTTSLGRLSASARLAAAKEMLSSSAAMSRAMSYASALQATPQDWHIQFSVNGQPIANDTTIYRAVHFSQSNPGEASGRLIWSDLHKITFKRVPGPPPTESSALSPQAGTQTSDDDELPPSLSQHPQTARIVRLMSILHSLNDNMDDVVSHTQPAVILKPEPLAQFVNSKLTAKLNRQLEEPLIVASNCLPSWAEDLARLYPFLFPFETRHLFMQSTSFGYSRSMSRWQSGQPDNDSRRHREERPFLGRTQRQKVRISRVKILESALKVMELYGSSPSILEVEYFEEAGTGLGPTLEFYSTVSRELAKKKIRLWRENESDPTSEYAFGKRGLFPAPMSVEQAASDSGKKTLYVFKLLGKFVARSMLDSRIIDITFNPAFFRVVTGQSDVSPSLGAIAGVDQDLANSLKDLMQVAKARQAIDKSELSSLDKVEAYKGLTIRGANVEDLGLDFTLPGYPHIELEPNGKDTNVTLENVDRYVEKVIDFTLNSGVQQQVKAFRAGFSQVFPYSAVKAFTPDELVMLFGRTEEDWSLETLMDSIKADHGFNLDSQSVRNLLQTMSEFEEAEKRDFLQFVSGSPKLPIGGFKSLTPMFTVVCKPAEPPLTSDEYLPSVMTCVNYLKLPDYSTLEVLKARLAVAIKEGQGAFHLS